MEKMTKKKALNFVLDTYKDIPAEVAEKLQFIVDGLDRKSASASTKLTARQVENEGLKALIIEKLGDGEKYTITEMMKFEGMPADISNQRVAQLVRVMKDDDGIIERIEEKRKAYFRLKA